MAAIIFYLGRAGQVLGMFMLLEDVVFAGPMGPNPRLFAAGVAVFIAGWALTRTIGKA
ncbi:MAG TPA: hypothetical protein VG222_08095 [Vicinamibacterales bacterium]|nr:hypothetical protein [Vicinamibacterales bacterium]